MQSGVALRQLGDIGRQTLRRGVPCASSCASVRFNSQWLQGRPPASPHSAGTVAAMYYKHVREFDIPTKDFVAAVGQDLKMTVEQFDRQVYAYAVGMLEVWGLKKGHKIAVWCTNELESVVAQYSAALIGIEVIVIDPALGFDSVKSLINAEGIRALLLSPRYGAEDRHTACSTEFEPELEYTLLHAGYAPISSKRFRSLKYLACTGKEFVDGVMRFNELPVYGTNGNYAMDDIAAVQSYITPSSPAFTYYSSVEGKAVKGRTVSHQELVSSAGASAKALALTGADVVLTTAPVWTFSGLSCAFLAAGLAPAKVVLGGKAFDAESALVAAETHRPSVVVTTPEHVAAMAAEVAKDAAMPADKQRFEGALSQLRTGFVLSTQSGATQGLMLGKAKLVPVNASKAL